MPEAGNQGRLIGLAERLGVAVAESFVLDAEFRSEGMGKFSERSSGKRKS